MNIAIATVQVPFVRGGAEVLAEGLLDALRAAGHKAEIVSIPFKWYPPERILDCMLSSRLMDLTEANGTKIDMVISLKFPAYFAPHPNKVHWLLHQHRSAYEMWGDDAICDLMHTPNGIEVRDAIRIADRRLLPEAKAIYTISANVSKRLKKFTGIDSTPLYHPPFNGEKLTCEPAENYFFFPSRINMTKRQDLAVKAMSYAKGDFELIIAGEPESQEYMHGMFRDVINLGIQHRVKFVGRISEEEKIRLYSRALGVVYVPFDEDYGYITLEAMLAGKPVITCSDSGGSLEFISHEEGGLIAEPTPASVGEAYTRLVENRAWAAEVGRIGRRKYAQMDISWANVVERLTAARDGNGTEP